MNNILLMFYYLASIIVLCFARHANIRGSWMKAVQALRRSVSLKGYLKITSFLKPKNKMFADSLLHPSL